MYDKEVIIMETFIGILVLAGVAYGIWYFIKNRRKVDPTRPGRDDGSNDPMPGFPRNKDRNI